MKKTTSNQRMIFILTIFLISIVVTPVKASSAFDQAEMPLLTQINFNTYSPTPFGNQDVNPTMTIEDGGATLHLKGNSWKKISLSYTVTAYTVLEFDFKSPAQGEVLGVGFDNDQTMSESFTHKLYGTQTWGTDVPFYRYATAAPGWMHYRIPVGEYYTGNMLYLVFVNDHDVSNPTGESYFSNLEVFEDPSAVAQPPVDVDFDEYTISPYDGAGESPALTMTIEANGDTLHMAGNGKLKISLPYTVTTSTVIEFDYQSTSQGEVQGIGFDTDDAQQENRTFALHGTQAWGLNAFRYSAYAGSVKHFRIPVGKYYTGDMRYLFFFNDQDVSNPTANGWFSNLSIYEGDLSLPVTIDFNQYAFSPYYSLTGSNPPGISIEDNGNTLHLTGNGWTQISMPVPVLTNTILAFDFKSTAQGEIHALGFDTDQNTDPGLTFKLYGTQAYGLTNFNDYAASAPNWKHYEIPVGQYYTGQQLYLFFANDHDIASPTAESYFSNVVIFNQPPTSTPTFTPTATFTPTSTFTPSVTPTFTPTPTPTPQDRWYTGNSRGSVYGIKANISVPATELFLYTSGESSYVTTATTYWIQTGWRHYKAGTPNWSYTLPMEYVEINPPPPFTYVVQHYNPQNWGEVVEYKITWSSGVNQWCAHIDGDFKMCQDLGFSAPTYVNAHSEVHISPQNELSTTFLDVSYLDNNSVWNLFDVGLWREDAPYQVDKFHNYEYYNFGP